MMSCSKLQKTDLSAHCIMQLKKSGRLHRVQQKSKDLWQCAAREDKEFCQEDCLICTDYYYICPPFLTDRATQSGYTTCTTRAKFLGELVMRA